MTTYTYLATDEDPSIPLAWLDRNGDAIDLSAATFVAKLVNRAGNTALTKTSGITGYSSLQNSAYNNALITWAAGELNIAPGVYTLVVQATVAGRQRTFGTPISVVIKSAPS